MARILIEVANRNVLIEPNAHLPHRNNAKVWAWMGKPGEVLWDAPMVEREEDIPKMSPAAGQPAGTQNPASSDPTSEPASTPSPMPASPPKVVPAGFPAQMLPKYPTTSAKRAAARRRRKERENAASANASAPTTPEDPHDDDLTAAIQTLSFHDDAVAPELAATTSVS